ncbi:MAG: hypothetical protein Q7V56_09300 [Gammaproteobacteria bacterium]|nr:hypothetical protein [Gammaproteobacteria bacterium]
MKEKQYVMRSVCALAATFSFLHTPFLSAQPARGGFLETPNKSAVRTLIDASALRSFIPQRGVFRFPAPYNSDAVRLTNATDCAGNDCVNYAGYSYWRNMNNHVGKESMLIFLGLDQTRGGKGPTLFEFNKVSGELKDLGPLFPSRNHLSWATGEGWYFSATLPTTLYINDGPRIVRFDVITEEMRTVVDISDQLGSGVVLTQMHTSDNDRVHSATVRDSGNYRVLGCMAYEEDGRQYHYYPITQDFDECQVDRSGEWLVVKANLDGRDGEDNLVVNLRTGDERIIRDKDGAAGHSDMGHGYMIAADNWASDANTWKLWDFNEKSLKGKRVYYNKDWNVFAPAHVSHTNAQSGVAPSQQYACGSSINRSKGIHANEVVCFNMDGSSTSLVVAPLMTDLDAPGGDNEYARYAKGNLDITGRYFLWTSNMGGSRLDAFIVHVPGHLLTGVTDNSIGSDSYDWDSDDSGSDDSGSDDSGSDDAPASSSVHWQTTRNITVAGNRITKTSGCDGCGDAGSISEEALTADHAHMEFTVGSSWALMLAGFSQTQEIPVAEDLVLGLRLQSGMAEVRESGNYRAEIRYQDGDRFSISINAGRASYAHNGTVFYSSEYTAENRLFAGTALYNVNAAVEDVTLLVD